MAEQVLVPHGVATASHPDKAHQESFNPEKVLEAVRTIQDLTHSQEVIQKEAHVQIATNEPILVLHLADLHLGNVGTDHTRFVELMELIRKTPNVFFSLQGDELDNFGVIRSFGDAADEDMFSTATQARFCLQFVNQLDEMGKLLWVTTGNHNLFNKDWYQLFGREFRAPVIGTNYGIVKLQVGEVEYHVFTGHHINLGNSVMSHDLRHSRVIEFFDANADLVILAHTHRLMVEQLYWGVDSEHKLRTFIDGGTLKTNDSFQRAQGNARYGNYHQTGACTTLYPTLYNGEKRVEVFMSPEQGIEYLQSKIALRQILEAKAGDLLSKIARL